MTLSLSNLVPSSAVDVVGVFDESFNQLFPEGRPMKAAISETATFFKHPLESTATRTDHIIFEPVEIAMTVLLTGSQYRDTYQQIKQVFQGQTPLVVQTKTDTYANMYIQAMPHDETPEAFDSVLVNLSLVETLVSDTEVSFQPISRADANTEDRGQQQAEGATPAQQQQGSALYRIFN